MHFGIRNPKIAKDLGLRPYGIVVTWTKRYPWGRNFVEVVLTFQDIGDRGIERTEVLDNENHETPKPEISVRERSGMRRSHDSGKGRTYELGF